MDLVARRARCLQIFGPVLVALPFRTAKEAQALGNNTNYGLAASVWTENLPTGWSLLLLFECTRRDYE